MTHVKGQYPLGLFAAVEWVPDRQGDAASLNLAGDWGKTWGGGCQKGWWYHDGLYLFAPDWPARHKPKGWVLRRADDSWANGIASQARGPDELWPVFIAWKLTGQLEKLK